MNGGNPLVRRRILKPAPVEPAPVEPAPVEPAPVEPASAAPAPIAVFAYDPGERTVAKVIQYALGCEQDEVMAIRRAEAAGRKRSTLLAELDSMLA